MITLPNVRKATKTDLSWMRSLANKNSSELGFVPSTKWEKVMEGEHRQKLLVIEDNGDQTGFIYGCRNIQHHARIYQVCVQEDARRWLRATMLVDRFIDEIKGFCVSISCRVAVDIEANFFWTAMGFRITNVSVGQLGRLKGTKQRPILVFFKSLSKGLFPDMQYQIDNKVTVQGVQHDQ